MDAKELLQKIKERALVDVDLSSLAGMSEEERRELLLQQTERLLSTRENRDIITWMAEQILDRQGGVKDDNPILDYDTLDLKDDIKGLNNQETVSAQFVTRLAYFSYCMYNKYGDEFFTDRYLGINGEYDEISLHDEFWISNTALVNWVKTTPYRRVAAGVVSEMISVAGNEAERQNSVEQDYFYGFFSAMALDLSDIAQCNEYMLIGLQTLEQAERHKQQAVGLGIDRECASIVDALCGTLMNDYPREMVACAKELQQQSTSLLPDNTVTMSRKEMDAWPLATLRACDPILKNYGIDLNTKEQNLSRNYLQDWLYLKYKAKMYGAQF